MPVRLAFLLLAVLLPGCRSVFEAVEPAFERIGAEDAFGLDDYIVADVFLIGDAGEPGRDGEPVLEALSRRLDDRPERAVVVFLGDNIYPEGLPPEGDDDRAEAERHLLLQMEVPLDLGARAIFVPGNHDWSHSRADGWDRIRAQAAFIDAHGDTLVTMLPRDGCPGPAVVDVAGAVRLVAVDSQWFLHGHARPEGDACTPPATEAAFVEALRATLAEAATRADGPLPVIVVAHHPIVSGGAHGILPRVPRRAAARPMFSPQDLGHPRYRAYRSLMAEAFAEHPPLVYAAGHDHSLQVIENAGGAEYALVSGAGIYGHTSPVRRERGALYAERRSGFMRVSIYDDGRIRMRVYEVSESGRARIGYSKVLAPRRR